MKVIITGGSGLIGRELTASLCSDGHEVIILSRTPAKVTDLPSRAKAVQWDGRTAQGWAQHVDGADAVMNLAGENIAGGDNLFGILLKGRWTPARKRALRESRVNAGRAVTEAIKAASRKPSVLIQASAVGYYGNQGNNELTETSSAGSDFAAQILRDFENSTAEVERLGVRRVIIRSAVVLSSLPGILQLIAFPYRLFVGGALGNGKQWFPWIHMEDEIGAIRFLMERSSASGPYNLCSPQPLTNDAFGKLLGKTIRRPHWLPAPAFALRLVLGEIADSLLLTSQRQVPARLKREGYRFKFPEADTALMDLLR
ncbi:MAG: TIGR01777 family oxidoreductase [Anaerolineales bacterium]